MAITAFTSPVSGLWPLGQFTVATVGTPVNLNFNVGAQTESGATPSRNVRGFLISVPSGSAGNIYLMRRVNGQTVSAAGTPNFIIAVVYPGNPIEIGSGGGGGLFNVDDYCLDTDGAGAVCNVTAIYG